MIKFMKTAVALGLACVPALTEARDLGSTGSAHHNHHAVAVTMGTLNLRTGPGTSYRVITAMPRNADVAVHDCLPGGSWCRVTFAGLDGWAWGRLLHPVRPHGPEVIVIPKGYELKAIVGTGRYSRSTVIILPE